MSNFGPDHYNAIAKVIGNLDLTRQDVLHVGREFSNYLSADSIAFRSDVFQRIIERTIDENAATYRASRTHIS